MLDAKDAVRQAVAFVVEMFGERAQKVRLEEITKDPKNSFWHVTLSFIDADELNPISALGGNLPRIYKTIKITPAGDVYGMEIHK